MFTLEQQGQSQVRQESAETLYVMRPVGKLAIPDLQSGKATLTIRAARPVLFGLRHAETVVTRNLRSASTRRASRRCPPSTTSTTAVRSSSCTASRRRRTSSGVRVGDKEYAGFPATGAGITSDPALRVAFFALLYDQDRNTPIQLFARDEADNEATVPLDHMVFPKPFSKSRIELTDSLPAAGGPRHRGGQPRREDSRPTTLLAGFLTINGDLRQKNNAYVASLAAKSAPEMMFKDAFHQLGNSQVEAKFADARTYVYKGKEVDRQVHLGFDLAVTAQVPIVAAHNGKVVHAGDLGIYGNCVILDHGLGVQSLYGHLSSIDVKVGDTLEQGADDRPQRHDRPGGRRPPAFHDAGGRTAGEPGGLVEQAVDGGPGAAEDFRGRRRAAVDPAAGRPGDGPLMGTRLMAPLAAWNREAVPAINPAAEDQ